VDISANGDRVVISTNESLMVVDAQGQQLWQQPTLNTLDVSISADGHWVAAGTSDHIAKLWEGNTGRFRAIFPGHTDRVSSVDFRADGRILVSGSWDGTARFWSLDVLETDPLVLAAQSEKLWNLPFQEALAAAVQ
jgi:WD40 repeat protein